MHIDEDLLGLYLNGIPTVKKLNVYRNQFEDIDSWTSSDFNDYYDLHSDTFDQHDSVIYSNQSDFFTANGTAHTDEVASDESAASPYQRKLLPSHLFESSDDEPDMHSTIRTTVIHDNSNNLQDDDSNIFQSDNSNILHDDNSRLFDESNDDANVSSTSRPKRNAPPPARFRAYYDGKRARKE